MNALNFIKKCVKSVALLVLLLSFSTCEEVGQLVTGNQKLVIDRLYALQETLDPADTTTIIVEAHDPEDESLAYQWSGNAGVLSTDSGPRVIWTAPTIGGNYEVSVKVTDTSKGKTDGSVSLTVLAIETPFVNITNPKNAAHIPGLGVLNVEAEASHPNGIKEVLFYVNNVFAVKDNSLPYTFQWQIEEKTGKHKILAEAIRASSGATAPGVDSVSVTLEGVTRID